MKSLVTTEKTDLAKAVSSIGWVNGNELICYCEDIVTYRKVISEGLYQAMSLYNDNITEPIIKFIVSDWIKIYTHEPASLFVDIIEDLMRGKHKVYGKITPADLNEILQKKLEEIVIARERQHQNQKGYGDQEAGRTYEPAKRKRISAVANDTYFKNKKQE